MPDPVPQAPGSSASVQPSQQPERQRFEELLQRVQKEAQAQGQENAVLRVQAGRPVIYKGVPSQDPVSESIPNEAVQKVLKAVEEPQDLNGTVKLSVNSEVIFYNQKGDISEDTYKLANQQQVTQESSVAPQQTTQATQTTVHPRQDEQVTADAPKLNLPPQPQASVEQKPQVETTTSPNNETTPDIPQRQGQIAPQEAPVAKQQQPQQTKQHTNLNRSAPAPPVNNKAENWLQSIRNKMESTLLQAAKQTVKTGAAILGEKQTDGSTVVHSQRRNQSLVVDGDKISIKDHPAIDPKAMWKHYTQKVQVKGPFYTAAEVARTAWKEGMPEGDIRKVLSANPAIKQFGKKGQELVDLPLQKVKREAALSDQSNQQSRQQTQQRSKDNSLSM